MFAIFFNRNRDWRLLTGGSNETLMKELGCTDPKDASMVLIEKIWEDLQEASVWSEE